MGIIDRVNNRLMTLWVSPNIYIPTENIGNNEMDSCEVYMSLFKKGKNYTVYSAGIGNQINFELDLIKKVEEKGAHIELYAFDPTPRSIAFLNDIDLPDNFHFYPYAISDKDKNVEFALPTADGWISGSTADVKNDSRKLDFENRITVPGKTIRTIMKELGHDRIDLLKMDIEGAEFDVLDAYFKDGHNSIDMLLLDHHEYMLKKNGKTRMKQLLNQLDEVFYVFQADNESIKNPHIGCIRKGIVSE